jgi:hypothetical protein
MSTHLAAQHFDLFSAARHTIHVHTAAQTTPLFVECTLAFDSQTVKNSIFLSTSFIRESVSICVTAGFRQYTPPFLQSINVILAVKVADVLRFPTRVFSSAGPTVGLS